MIRMNWLRQGIAVCMGAVAAGSAASPGTQAGAPPSALSVPSRLAPLPQFRHFGSEDGLPTSRVFRVAQDHDGYLWFATADGIARYDGVDFRIWRHDLADSDSLGGNETSALLIDSENRVWVGIEDAGLDVLDAQRGAFRHFRHRDGDSDGLPGNDVFALAQDRDGMLWVGTYLAGLVRLDPRSGRVIARLRHDEKDASSIASDNVWSLLADSDGTLWIGSDHGVERRAVDGSVRRVDVTAWSDADGLIVQTLTRSGADVIAGTNHGALRIDAALKAHLLLEGQTSGTVYAQAQTTEGALWFASLKGLWQRAPDGALHGFFSQPGVYGSLGSNALYDALVDREQGLWLVSFDSGVAYLSPQWRNFSLWQQIPGSGTGLGAKVPVTLTVASDGAVWSFEGGDALDRLEPDTGRIDAYAQRLGLEGMRVTALLVDRRGRLWASANRSLHMVDLLSTQAGAFTSAHAGARGPQRHEFTAEGHPDGMLGGTIESLIEDADGAIWAAVTGSGMVRIGADLQPHAWRVGTDGAPRSSDFEQLGVDAQGRIWAAHVEGLDWCMRPCTRFAAVPGSPTTRVQAFDFASDGSLWTAQFGTLQHWRVDERGISLIEHFDTGDGWPAMNAFGLMLDLADRPWVTSSRGLYRFDPATRRVRRFDASDGLPPGEFTDHNLRRDAHGRLFAGTREGLLAFDPMTLRDNVVAPPLVLGEISVQRGAERTALPPSANISWRDRDLRIVLRALSFAAPPRYQTRLQDFDSDWVDTPRGEREFGQLAAGRYRLEARAASAGGEWTTLASPPLLDVEAAPWRRWWAWCAYVLMLAAALALAFRSWRRRVQRRHEFALTQQRRELAELASSAKSDFLAHMGHEIRTPMTGLLGMGELLLRGELTSQQRDYAEGIVSSGQHMLRLVNDALDLARIEAGRLELERDAFDPTQLLREVAEVLQPLALSKGLGCALNLAEGLPCAVMGDARRVRQILLNLGTNAVKFTAAGSVRLALSRDGDALVYSVKDSGAGIALEQQQRLFQRYTQTEGGRRAGGSGLGLAICRELAELMQGRIELDSEPGRGSEFRVVLPLEIATETAVAAHALAFGATRDAPGPAASALSLLLVEDDANAATTLRGLLELLGHRVRHAPHGLAALSELEQGGIDAVLCDLDLPGIDGLALVRTWRAREALGGAERIPFIALTARTEPDIESRTLAAGMQAFQRKPVTSAMLAQVLAPWAKREVEAA